MKNRQRKIIEVFNLSFLDVVTCGFGAIILLLVISKIIQPIKNKEESVRLRNNLTELVAQKNITQKKLKVLKNELSLSEQHLRQLKNRYKKNITDLKKKQNDLVENDQKLWAKNIIKEKMYEARQSLTVEMQRLLRNKPVINKQNTVGGISVDSEYILFIIDTSGSMKNYAWPLVRKKMQEILDIHPKVKGIQVMNDMGEYMFSQYAGKWITDTPARRAVILKQLASWEPFSNSSPEEGITRAIRHFYAADKPMSLFIFADDFSRGSIQSLLDTVDRLNRSDQKGKKRVRINAVGFPVLFTQPDSGMNIYRFSTLMRKLAEKNNGSFVGLSRLK